MNPTKIFTPPRFTLYDRKSAPRSHISYVRHMMALWNHMDALMCRVFPSSLGDLRLKWVDKLPADSIENFHHLTKLFVALFIINTKAPKCVESLLTLRKGKNESIRNYSKRYWKTYNEIEECSKKLAMASYKLRLTPKEKLWENLMLDPQSTSRSSCPGSRCSSDWRSMSDRQKRLQEPPLEMKAPFKKRKESPTEYEKKVRQGVNVVFKEPIYKFLARI